MKLLVLGGTVFLSRAVATEAVGRGHEVVCACRGESGHVPEGASLVAWDRSCGEVPVELSDADFDAMVDVARVPSWVRTALAALPEVHWVFVSTVSVYADESTPGARPGLTPLVDPITEDLDPESSPQAYGAMKVACEELVRSGAATATIIRPGLIIGPDDPTGRFTYWPHRIAAVPPAGGEVLAPGDPDDVVQVIDVRDLAAWIVTCCETRLEDTYDGVGPATPIRDLLADVAEGVGVHPNWVWVDQDFLAEQGVEPWAGPGSVPLWLPRPAYDGMLAHDAEPSLAAGLSVRPVAETARATRDWLEQTPGAQVTGIDPARELQLIEAWRARSAQ